MRSIQAASAVFTCAAVLLSACATTPPPPSADMTRAKAAIEQAQRAGAREYATEYLNASMAKMDLAEAANAKGNYAQATRLVEESYADAHLAQLTAQSAKSAKAAADVDQSIRTLQHEANRPATP
jgi:Domain of unknown function (DUF4398)